MSRQLAISAAFSVLMMAIYVLFGSNSVRVPLGVASTPGTASVEISTPALADAGKLLPVLR